jgi:hypothetical protein
MIPLKLADCRKDVEQQSPCGSRRIDRLIEHDELRAERR